MNIENRELSQKLVDTIEFLKQSISKISVYDLNYYSMTELYYGIANKINELIEMYHEFGVSISEEIIKQNECLHYLLNDGLNTEVVKKINQMVADGTMDTIINHNVFNSLNDKIDNYKEELSSQIKEIMDIRINVNSLGLVASDINVCSDKLQEILNGENRRLYFPKGRYIIDRLISINSDTDILCDNDTEFYLADGSCCQMFATEMGQSLKNIKWVGGIINGNHIGQGEIGINRPTQSGNSHWNFSNGFIFHNVNNLHVENVRFKDIRGQSIHHWNCNKVIFRNLYFEGAYSLEYRPNGGFRTDCINGGSSNMLIENIYGFSDDDMIAVLSGVSWGGTQVGDIHNITIRNINCISRDSIKPYRAVRIACANGYSTSNVVIEDVKGDVSSDGIFLGGYDDFWGGKINNVSINNCHITVANKNYASGILIRQAEIGVVKVNDSTFLIKENGKVFINNENCKVGDLHLNNVSINFKSSKDLQIIRDVLNNDLGVNKNLITNIHFNSVLVTGENLASDSLLQIINRYQSKTDNANLTRLFGVFGDISTQLPIKTVDDGYNYVVNSKTIKFKESKVTHQKENFYLLNSNGDLYVTHDNNFIECNNSTAKTITSYYSFTPFDKTLLINCPNDTMFRIEEDTSFSFPVGYEIQISRIDNNNTTPYIQLNDNTWLNGAKGTNIVIFYNDTITLKYIGENRWIVKEWQKNSTFGFLYTGNLSSNAGRIIYNASDNKNYIVKKNVESGAFVWVEI